tara:strand:- start:12 stop:548 length:537 start_codon:yes stop_codon:yes gene_type:complete
MAKKTVYEMLFSFEAPDIKKSENAGKVVTQFFEEGEIVIGEPYKNTKIIVEDRYIIPFDYVEKTEKFPFLKKDSKFDETISRIKEQSVIISEKEKSAVDELGNNVKDVVEGKTKKKLEGQAVAYKNGAIIGLGSGVLLALYLKKNIWTLGLLGVAVGGYVSHKLYKSKQGNNIVEKLE